MLKRCCVCHRVLTSSHSKAIGIGPVCEKNSASHADIFSGTSRVKAIRSSKKVIIREHTETILDTETIDIFGD